VREDGTIVGGEAWQEKVYIRQQWNECRKKLYRRMFNAFIPQIV
jgi:hypothetical protein